MALGGSLSDKVQSFSTFSGTPTVSRDDLLSIWQYVHKLLIKIVLHSYKVSERQVIGTCPALRLSSGPAARNRPYIGRNRHRGYDRNRDSNLA